MSSHVQRAKLTHEAPVLESKAPLQRVEWQVAARALGVVVWAGHLGAGRLEAAAGDESRGRSGAEGSTGEYLGESAGHAIGAEASVLWRWGRVERCRCWWSDAFDEVAAAAVESLGRQAPTCRPCPRCRASQLFVMSIPAKGVISFAAPQPPRASPGFDTAHGNSHCAHPSRERKLHQHRRHGRPLRCL